MNKEQPKILLLVFALFALTACSSLPIISQRQLDEAYIKKSEAEKQLQQVKENYQVELAKNSEQLSSKKDSVIDGQDAQLQAGANALYRLQQATSLPYTAGLLEFISARSVEGFTAMGRPPSIKEIVEGGERLKSYLAAYQGNDQPAIEKLKREHDELVKQNGILVETTKLAKQEVETVKKERQDIEQKFIADNAKAQADLNVANDQVIKKENARAEAEKKAREKAEGFERLKRQLMIWCGIGAVLTLAGAVYSPVGKTGLAIISGVLGLATVSLPFVQPWMVWILFGVVAVAVLAALGLCLYRHNLAEVANTNMIHAIEDTKEKKGATVEDLRANLKAWNTKYVKAGAGKIVTVTDQKIEDYINSKLMQTGRLEATTATSTETKT